MTREEDPFVPTNMDLAGFWDMVHIQVIIVKTIMMIMIMTMMIMMMVMMMTMTIMMIMMIMTMTTKISESQVEQIHTRFQGLHDLKRANWIIKVGPEF